MSLASHQRRDGTVTWLTPPEWIEKLGPFDLDPCCPPVMPWPTAKTMLTENSTGGDKTKWRGGLAGPWHGRVWLNPPFGRQAHMWVAKLAAHGNGIALLHACTETDMYYDSVWPKADAICFTGPSRPHFYDERGNRAEHNSGAAIALIAYGQENVAALYRADLGIVLPIPKSRATDRTSDS